MRILEIPKTILCHPNKYLFSKDKYDLLGSIIIILGLDIPEKIKVPSQLKEVISPFTISRRGIVLDTSLTLAFLQLDFTHISKLESEANLLLTKHQIGFRVKIT